jgi:hypothetical protein
MADPCIPVFDSAIQVTSDPNTILAYIVTAYMKNPAGYFDNYFDMEISFAKDTVIAKQDQDSIKAYAISNLETVIRRYFPTADTVTVNVTFSLYNTDAQDVTDYIASVQAEMTIGASTYKTSDSTVLKLGNGA